jgi:trans-aconitate methyltransferase
MPIGTPSQEWNSSRYDKNARFVSDLGEPLVDLLAPQPGERILDLACGDGVLTEKIIARGAELVGVDGSADMVAAAQKRGIDARVVDAYQLNFTSEFDAVFSNAALHWMKRDPDAVIRGVRRARPRCQPECVGGWRPSSSRSQTACRRKRVRNF